jgi:Rhs element Vgr protein
MNGTVSKSLSNEINTARFNLEVNGSTASPDVMHDLLSITVEQTLHLPSMCVIKVYNDQLKWFDNDTFNIGKTVLVKMGLDTPKLVFKGEITALELDGGIESGAPILTVRAYDKTHRLHRGRKTRPFPKVAISDLIKKVCSDAGLAANVNDTGEVFDYILQNNESNFEFLKRWAYRIGMELYLDIHEEKLKLRKLDQNSSCGKVTWGLDLRSFNGRMTSHDQVDQVMVRGWDPKTKKEVVGIASSDTNASIPKVATSSAKDAAKKAFEQANTASVYRFVNSQRDAETIAKAIFDDLNGRGFQIDGSCLGNPDITPGKWLEVDKLGKYSGKYYLTSCTHRYHSGGYITFFEANGRQNNTLLELTNQAGSMSNTINGVVIGIVTSNLDTEKTSEHDGWVKVKYPWLPQNEGNDIVSDWARVATPMSGNGHGIQFLPEVNDEVLVAFEHGDPQRPFVVGSLWNGKDKAPRKVSEIVANGQVNTRTIKTRAGHTLVFEDKQGKEQISIIDKSEKNKIIIDTTGKKITIETDTGGQIELISPNGKIKMEAKDIEIKGTQSAKVDTVQLELKGSQSAKMEGAQVEVKGEAQTQISGATTKVSGSAAVEVSGGIIKLN